MSRQVTSRRVRYTCHFVAAWAVLLSALAAGCSSTLPVRPLSYDVDVRLDPETHSLTGRTTLALAPVHIDSIPTGPASIDLKLHPDLQVDNIEVAGATLRSHSARPAQQTEDHPGVLPTTHRLQVTQVEPEIRVTVDYHGELFQDVAAGEEEGQVHNFAMAAHVGMDGIYLDESGYWYPLPVVDDEANPELSLADYTLTTDPVDGFEFVAGLERQPGAADGRLHWASAFPLNRTVLLGGPLKRWTRQHGDITLHAVLDPGKEEVAMDILDASAEYLDKYQPLIGPYPFKEFTLLEAFFSSGFAFPTCTQIVGSQLTVYKQHRRHGYLDHELLHNWYGNGIYVDPRDGNWCEAFASFGGNYYGYVLDDDAKGARKQRRNQSNFLSAIKPDRDKPLATYGQEGGAGRGIAYSKGAAVLHMLERKIGAETFFAALRRLTAERMGKYTNWAQIQQAFEAESGADLSDFFAQWVHGGGAPLLELTGAEWKPGSSRLTVWISQGDTDFDLDVPLRLYYGEERTEDVVATIDERSDKVTVPCETTGLTAVELDPDYHVFRKLKQAEVMPTSAMTRRAKNLVIVVPAGELSDPYQLVVDSFTRAVQGKAEEPKPGTKVQVVSVEETTADKLRGSAVLVIGEAVRNGVVAEFLEQAASPATWTDDGFVIEGQAYTGDGQATFFTIHHPTRLQSGVTVYYGNSVGALANARVLTYYPNSLLVFETPTGDAEQSGGEGMGGGHMPRSEVIRRMDFESHDRVEF